MAPVLMLLFTTACGYRMVAGGDLPGNIQSVAVHVLTNRTGETGLEAVVTNALVGELNRLKPGVIMETGAADAILTGSIGGLISDTIAHTDTRNAQERIIVLTVLVDLTTTDGTPIWKNRTVTAEETYLTSGDRIDTDASRRQAIALAAQRAAESVARRLMEDF
jgi:outer membrane lipopolysaccharide assembly protein LptE/RlpB